MNEFLKIDDSVAPQAEEIIVTKRRISAFTGSDLEVVLRAKRIQHIVLTGVSTSALYYLLFAKRLIKIIA